MNTPFDTTYEIDLYKRLPGMEPTNPYVMYNNTDRLLNAMYRAFTIGGLADRIAAKGETWRKDQLEFKYERQTNVISQYYWASTAILGVSYAALRPDLYSPYSGDDDKDTLGKLVLARAIVNATIETTLLVANLYRYGAKMGRGILDDTLFDPGAKPIAYIVPRVIDHGEPELRSHLNLGSFIQHSDLPLDSGRRTIPPAPNYIEIYASQRKFELDPAYADYRAKVKNVRSWVGGAMSAAFTLNAIISVGIASRVLNNAVNADKFDGYTLASAILSLTTALGNVMANGFKSLNGVGLTQTVQFSDDFIGPLPDGKVRGKVSRFSPGWNKAFGIAGSAFGLVNGVAGIVSLAPYIGRSDLSDTDKGVIGAEMGVQVLGGTLQAISNTMLAVRVAKGATTFVPALGAAAGALAVAMSPLEIYGMVKQSKYANELDKLNKEMMQYGYEGNGMLAELYRKKTGADAGILTATTVLSIVGSAVAIGSAATGVGAPVALVAELATAAVGAILKGVQQAIIEKIAKDYAEKIKDEGGSFSYFADALVAQNKQIMAQAGVHLEELKAEFGVDSVVAVTTPLLSKQALELAAITRNAANLKTADSFVNRFGTGKDQGQSMSIDSGTGVLNLGGASGSKQLLTFLNPLLSSGTESRVRVKSGKDSYKTTLTVKGGNQVGILRAGGWAINDGASSSTMDLRKVISSVLSDDGKTSKGLTLTVNGGSGDDVVIAGASEMTFDGGTGNNLVTYGNLGGDARIEVTELSNGDLRVVKHLNNVSIYQEVTKSENFSYGKRTENTDYRTYQLATLSGVDVFDTLVNVQNIRGGAGDDSITGNGRDNMLSGGSGNDTLNGGNGNDRLYGGAGNDAVRGGDGNDVIMQDMDVGNDILDGGDGIDTLDYSTTDLTGRASKGLTVDLGSPVNDTVTVAKVLAGTTANVGATGRYIRIYHDSDAWRTLALTELQVYAGGVNVAASIKSVVGVDGGVAPKNLYNNPSALTDGAGGGKMQSVDKSNITLVSAVHGYIELDLGSVQAIDSMSLWGIDGFADYGNDLRVYVSRDAFKNTATAYADLAANPAVTQINLGAVATTPTMSYTDRLTGIQNVIGTSLGDVLAGDAESNFLAGGAGDDVLYGREGRDTLSGGAGTDVVRGGEGDDTILQGVDSVTETLYGDGGNDTVDYSGSGMAGGIVATLGGNAKGTVVKTLAGTSINPGATGRYIRIYHSDMAPVGQPLSLTGLKVYVGGVDVARLKTTMIITGNDGGAAVSSADNLSNATALTDASLGAGALARSAGTKPYFELDLGSVQAIDSITLWGNPNAPGESNNLRVYVSNTPFASLAVSTATTYADLAVHPSATRFDLGAVETTPTKAYKDTLVSIENVIGTALADTLTGDANDNMLAGGAGADVLNGGDGKDTLTGGLGADILNGGNGNDVIIQDIDASADTLNGGDGDDTVVYNLVAGVQDILPDLPNGTITKIFRGTTGVLKASGQYIRIYHTNEVGALALTELNVFAGGVNVAAGKKSKTGADAEGADGGDGSWASSEDALTDGSAGGAWNGGGQMVASNMTYISGTKPYIELDLGRAQSIDALSFWGVSNRPSESNNLRVYVSSKPFNSATYAELAADASVAKLDVEIVDTVSSRSVVDKVTSIEYVQKNDIASIGHVSNSVGMRSRQANAPAVPGGSPLIGDDKANMLLGINVDEVFTGAGGDDVLSGGGGNDTLNGGDGDDVLAGGAGIDRVIGGMGDDLILQDVQAASETLTGGDGNDTVDYSITDLAGVASTGIVADLGAKGDGQGRVTKRIDISAVVGATGRYIRIYHTTSLETLTLTGLKVYAGGDDVAAGKPSQIGADGGLMPDLGPIVGNPNDANNPLALTDAAVGDAWNNKSFGDSDVATATGSRPYIELDLGGVQTIDSIALWGRADMLAYSNNLRVYVSSQPFVSSATAYRDLAADSSVVKVDVAFVENRTTASFTDTLIDVENMVGTALADTITGDGRANTLSGGAGNDVLNGGAGDDALIGDVGGDTLNGGEGSDALSGGSGMDKVNGGNGDDVISQDLEAYISGTSGVWDALDGGDGIDTVDYSSTVFPSGARMVMGAMSKVGISADLSLGKVTKYVGTGFSSFDSIKRIENVIGSALDDRIAGDGGENALSGDKGDDVISGGSGHDLLAGGDGNDVLSGDAGDDTLVGGLGVDIVRGGDGNDAIQQNMECVDETLDGGDGSDTVYYSGNGFAGSVVADLSSQVNGRSSVVKTIAGTSVGIGTTGQFIRIYHTDAVSIDMGLSLTELKVYAGGVDVAANLASVSGADGNYQASISNDTKALTDGTVGAGSLVYADGIKPYIELNLGSVQTIDTIKLWGAPGFADRGNNLRIYVSNAPFKSSIGSFIELEANSDVAQFDVAVVATVPSTTAVDTLVGIENLTGSALNDTLTGDGKDNTLSGDAGNDNLSGGAGNDNLSGGAGDDILAGGDGNDILTGGAGTDTINGGDGDDMIAQEIGRAGDTLSGGNGVDTVDYSVTDLTGLASTGITANLAAGKVSKVFAGTSVKVGAMGRYIRIYHTDAAGAAQALTLTEMKVFSGGVNVATDRESTVGVDRGSVGGGSSNNSLALTNGAVGGAWNGGASTSNLANVTGTKAYIQLDLGSVQAIDSIALWGHTNASANSNNLRVYVSETAFTSSATAYKDLAANAAVARVDVATVDTAASVTSTDTLSGVENLVGTALADNISGDTNANSLSGGEGNDTLAGGAGNDTLTGGAGTDNLNGGDGDDLLIQDMERVSDTLAGGAGVDTVDYSISGMAGGIVANLAAGTVNKVLAGTSVGVGATGRYIRIYHTDTTGTLSLTGLKVYVGGIDVAANIARVSGSGARPYIELDLGKARAIDSIALWGRAGAPAEESSNLRVYVSSTAFSSATYATLAADANVGRVDVAMVDTAATTTVTDTLTGIENLIGTAMADSLTGDGNANMLSGGAGNDVLDGGAGDDRYLFNLGGGQDTITDVSGNDRLVFGAGITAAQIGASLANGRVTLSMASGERVSFAAPAINNYAIELFEFADGNNVLDAAWLNRLLNIAPTGSDKTLVLNEDGSYIITATDLGFSDASAGDSLSAVRIDSLPLSGKLSLAGASVAAAQVISFADLAAGRLTFSPAANANGSNYASLAFSVKDQYGAFDATPKRLTFNVTAVNDAPVLTGTKPILAAGTEDTAYTITQASLLAGFSDVEGSTLSVLNLIASNGTLSAFNPTTMSWTFTPNANYNGVVDLSYGVSDGTVSTPAAQSFMLVAVNDAPTLTAFTAAVATINEDSEATITMAQLLAQGNGADVDGTISSFAVKAVNSGTLRIGTTADTAAAWNAETYNTVDSTHNAYWTPALNANGTLNAFTAVARDNSGAESLATAQTTVGVAAVNDAPTLTAFTAAVTTVNEDSEAVITLAQLLTQGNELDVDDAITSFVVKAVSSGSLRIGTTADTAAAWNAETNNTVDATRSAYWTPALNANGTLDAFTVVAKDYSGAESGMLIQAKVAVTAVNDAPNGVLTISRVTNQNQTLTAVNAIADGDGLNNDTVSYQWLANGTAIAGATGARFTLGQEQIGKTISLQAKYTDGQNTMESVRSIDRVIVRDVKTLKAPLISGALSASINGSDGIDTLDYSISGGAGRIVARLDNYRLSVEMKATGAIYDVGVNGVENLVGAGLNDEFWGDVEANILFGGEGNDNLNGGGGNDTLVGGSGYDFLYGDEGDDLFVQDLSPSADTLVGDTGVDTADYSSGASIEGSIVANLTTHTVAKVLAAGATFTDKLFGIENLVGTVLNDSLTGDANANILSGIAGNDTLDGGEGNDTLIGGAGSDTYLFSRGGGADLIQENDATAGNKDVLRFGTSIDASQIWLRKINSDLELSLIGTSDRVTVSNWYAGSANHVEEIYAGGKKLLDTNVDKLVSAMAAFNPPAAGQTSLPANLQTALQPVIAANWTTA